MDPSTPLDPPSQATQASQPPAATPAPGSQIDPAKVKSYVSRLRDQQNLGLGLAGGAIGAAIGAGLWAVITAATNYQIGFMAIGVGVLTGYGVRRLGRGVDPVFGYAGAVLALAGCAAGNVMAVMIVVANHEHMALSLIASRMTPAIAWQMLTDGFGPIGVLFYGLGLYYGYKNSFHRITQAELAALS
jgi:hypothetical protein